MIRKFNFKIIRQFAHCIVLFIFINIRMYSWAKEKYKTKHKQNNWGKNLNAYLIITFKCSCFRLFIIINM